MHIQFARDARSNYEYGCDLRRLYPWQGVADPLWGSAIASVRPGESTTAHSHDEHETFLILKGHGRIGVDGETSEISEGDVIYLPPNSHHVVENLSQEERLDFLTIFWGSPEANERMIQLAEELTARRAQAV
jgi:mannose-6-phosphate isomerase-like protein (cupin superfamily)